MEKELEIKCILLGESGVGKTSIISRYVNDVFDPNNLSSSTVCYAGKKIEKNNRKIKLNIWDTIGQEKFRSISKMFINDTKIAILVYSITSEESFKSLDYWLNLYKDHLGEGTILGVAANKSDLFLEQEVPDEKGIEYAEKSGAIFGLISAKNNKIGLDKFIDKLLDAYLNKNKDLNMNESQTIKIRKKTKNTNEMSNKKEGGCCSSNNNKARQRRYDSIIKNSNGCISSVFLGNKGVGKTSIIKRIKGEKVNQNEDHTESINKVSIDYNSNNSIRIIVYDVNVDKMKTREFIETIKKSSIFFLVYDVYDKESLDNLGYWLEVINRCKEDENEKYLLYILGNKDDIERDDNKNEKIGDDIKYVKEGKKFGDNNNGLFKSVSARENRGVENIVGEGIESYLDMK